MASVQHNDPPAIDAAAHPLESRDPNLDFLRALAVTYVLLGHIMIGANIWNLWIFMPLSFATLGVKFFFIHTSLVLMQSLERHGCSGVRSVLMFYMRRALRIYPLSVTVLGVYLLYRITSHGMAGLTQEQIWTNFLLVQNLAGHKDIIGVMWTLPLELQMYLLLPFLFILFKARRSLLLLWALSFVVAPFVYRTNVLQHAPNFLAGVIAYRFAPFQKRHIHPALWPVVLFAATIYFAMYYSDLTGWIICLALGLVLGSFKPLPPYRIFSKIADYSYSIYLLHIPIISFSVTHFRPLVAWPLFAVAFVVATVAAHHFVELPLMNLARRLEQRSEQAGGLLGATPASAG